MLIKNINTKASGKVLIMVGKGRDFSQEKDFINNINTLNFEDDKELFPPNNIFFNLKDFFLRKKVSFFAKKYQIEQSFFIQNKIDLRWSLSSLSHNQKFLLFLKKNQKANKNIVYVSNGFSHSFNHYLLDLIDQFSINKLITELSLF
ncbi:hypothetical protein [Flammeovirga sp. EKP202]|uniref:hypothetical protein n=1 Tax=Flammeovirga sp. EKP202 TaxID=2770592 RepID=UPI00165F4F76|nr:hypothetical protein [Flammeovirga sp. EKP202]MBD0405125.1 hypothetical protein [Flammeovirga sp. EKP202]